MNSQIRSAKTILNNLVITVRLVWAASGYWTLAWILLLLVQGLLPGVTVYLTRYVVNSLVAGVGAGISWDNIQTVLIPVGLMAVVLLLTQFLQGASGLISTAQSELVQDHISELIHKQSVAIDYGCYESSEYYDQLERARGGAAGRSLALLESTGSLAQNTITLFTMAAILLPYGFWLPIILVISALPAFYVLLRVNKLQYQWSQRTTTQRRWLMYYDLLLTNSATAAEVRLFDFGDYFQSLYQKLRRQLRHEQLKLIKEQTLGRFVAGIIALFVTGCALAWMGRQVLLGVLTLGDLALFYQAFNQGQGIVKSLLDNLAQIYRNSLFISNLFDFLQIQPQIVDPSNPVPVPSTLKQEIRFDQVTFRYPGTEEVVLENFNLTIPAGKIVAIVGDNGAGKSTLIKLLCRFYDPDSGRIELDGINLCEFAVTKLRRLITVLFQSPIPYYTTAGENIALGDITAVSNQTEIEAAAQASGIHDKIMRLPLGYNTMLGKLFPSGTDLSGGQWQRLALARAFFRRAQIIILDEPTSAMDPWAEYDWLERFRSLAAGRTAVVITHRFTLAMQADMIHVMRAGRIVESGNHRELLTLGGLYAQSWQAQMESSSSQKIENGIV
ncbi:MAG: ABC transporter ATP-binding protein/permease [Pelatocladus maniniholoensis HA4357-MV3]|uniref:ABC transporter ATP-binding protein/permease n=1 Tax=Pelatocladus maniniholoensis HA4357-MV3 TaxID=1117104 RepID=A0A9E3H732_9NOST|nr:ABC transporter ATP-binding protein/permease [Pelatocladus maniniholoensis HA4357-MV3]BAZ65654.1 ABC transporter-related protein [Fischerella sp. NIES-4106]